MRGPVHAPSTGGEPAARQRGDSAGLSAVAWDPAHELELSEWLEHGRRFGAIGRGMAWWIGDWIRYGNARYGEKYTRAARVTGYDVQSLMNMAYVATHIAPSRRRAALSWSHHAEVVSLGPAQQDAWLDLAERERLSVHSLRLELRSARRGSRPSGRPVPRASASEQLVCPHCRHVIDGPPEASGGPSAPDVGRSRGIAATVGRSASFGSEVGGDVPRSA